MSPARITIEMEEAYIACRSMGHLMDFIPDNGGLNRAWKESRTVGRLTLQCPRCTSKRLLCLSKVNGEVLFSYYQYPPGYRQIGPKRLTKRDFRMAMMDQGMHKVKQRRTRHAA